AVMQNPPVFVPATVAAHHATPLRPSQPARPVSASGIETGRTCPAADLVMRAQGVSLEVTLSPPPKLSQVLVRSTNSRLTDQERPAADSAARNPTQSRSKTYYGASPARRSRQTSASSERRYSSPRERT